MSVDLGLSLFPMQRIDFLEIIMRSLRNIYLIIFSRLKASFSKNAFGKPIRDVIRSVQ